MNSFVYWSITSLLVITCIANPEELKEVDACFLVNSPMYCTCDASFPNEAYTVSCYVVSDLFPDDPTWTGFNQQRNIRHLTITSRTGSKISYIPTAVLRQINSLISFTLRDSDIDTLWPYTFVNMTNLEIIKLENDGIRTVEPFAISFVPNVTKIFLVNNMIQRIPREAFYRLPKLKELYLERNSITAIDDLAFLDLYNLESLELWDNEIQNITSKSFIGLNNLRHLFLYHNKLTRLTDGVFSGAPLLKELDLRNNAIDVLSPHAFDGLNHLEILRINHNRIKSLPKQIFKGIPNLRMIDLTRNQLTEFSQDILEPLKHSKQEIFELFIKENPLVCDCSLLWISKQVSLVKSITFRKELRHLRCIMPNSTVLQRIIRLSWVDLSCPPEPTTTSFFKTLKFTTEFTISRALNETTNFVPVTEEIDSKVIYGTPPVPLPGNESMHSPSLSESRNDSNSQHSRTITFFAVVFLLNLLITRFN